MKGKTTYSFIIKLSIILLLIANSAFIFAQDSNNNVANPYSVKSAYLVNICKYTSWENQEIKKNTTFKIYTIGKLPENGKISIPKNVRIDNRNIEIINVESIENIKDFDKVDVLYIYSISHEELREILKIVSNKNILTVSENSGYGELGVIINFFIKDNKVNFELNREAELKSKITLKSMLYKLKGNRVIDNKNRPL